MVKDTEATLLAFFAEVRTKREKAKALPEGDPNRSTLLAEYLAGKAEYNQRKDAFQQSKKETVEGTSSSTLDKANLVVTTEAATNKKTSNIVHAHKSSLKPRSDEHKNSSLLPASTLTEGHIENSKPLHVDRVMSPPTDDERNTTADGDRTTSANETGKVVEAPAATETLNITSSSTDTIHLSLESKADQLALIIDDMENSVKELKHEVKGIAEAVKVLTDSINDAGHSFSALSEQMRGRTSSGSSMKEVAIYILDNIISHGTTLFESALNQQTPAPSSQAEKEHVKRVRDMLWAGLSAFQYLNGRFPFPSPAEKAEERNVLDNIGSDVATADLGNDKLLPESGKRKLEDIEEEPDKGSEGPQQKPESKRLRSASKSQNQIDR